MYCIGGMLDSEGILNFTANVFNSAVLASSANNPTMEPKKKQKKNDDNKDKLVCQKVYSGVEKIGTAVADILYASLNREISGAKRARFDLRFRMKTQYTEGSDKYCMLAERLDEYRKENEGLEARLQKVEDESSLNNTASGAE